MVIVIIGLLWRASVGLGKVSGCLARFQRGLRAWGVCGPRDGFGELGRVFGCPREGLGGLGEASKWVASNDQERGPGGWLPGRRKWIRKGPKRDQVYFEFRSSFLTYLLYWNPKLLCLTALWFLTPSQCMSWPNQMVFTNILWNILNIKIHSIRNLTSRQNVIKNIMF